MSAKEFYKQFFGVDPIIGNTTINESAIRFAEAYAAKKVQEFMCECGEHDVVPVLGYENAIVGEVCRACGVKIPSVSTRSLKLSNAAEDLLNACISVVNWADSAGYHDDFHLVRNAIKKATE